MTSAARPNTPTNVRVALWVLRGSPRCEAIPRWLSLTARSSSTPGMPFSFPGPVTKVALHSLR